MESEEGAGAARFELFEQVARALTCDHGEGLIVVIDDLHCADLPGLRLLEFLATQSRPRGVHIVGTHRLSIDASGEALRTIGISSRAETVRLKGLSESDAQNLIAMQATFSPTKEILSLVARRSQGNPLFIRQIVGQLNSAFVSCGQEEDLLEEAQRIGPGLRWAVEARLENLDPEVVQVLGGCAVIGKEFDAALAGRVLGCAEESILELLEEPLKLEIVEERGRGGHFQFTHVLYQEVLYEGLSPRRRVAIHRSTLNALTYVHGALTGDLACTAARHCLSLPTSVDPDTSVRLLGDAAQWSEENLGFEEAVSYLEGALRVLEGSGVGTPRVRAELMVRLSGALRRSGKPSRAAEACRRATALARTSGNAEVFSKAALAYAPGFFALEAGVVDEYLIDTLEEARSLAEHCAVELRSRIAGRLAMALYWSDDDSARTSYGDEAVELAGLTDDASARVLAAVAREVSRWGPTGASERVALAAWAIEHAHSVGDREMELVCRLYRLTSLLQIGRFGDAWTEIEVFSRKAATSLHGGALWYRELFSALKAMIVGEWERAERSAQEMQRLGERVRDRNSENCAVIHEAYRELEYGSDARALGLISQQGERFPRVRSYQCGRAFLSATTGDQRTARRLLHGAVSERGLGLPKTIEWMISTALLAETCVWLRDKRSAAVLFKELSEHEEEFVVVVFSVAVWRPVSYFLARLAGLLGRYDEAERLFEKARQQSRAVGARSWLSHIDFGQAEMLRRRAWPGDGRRARELALGAEERAQQFMMKPLLGRIREFLWGESIRGISS